MLGIPINTEISIENLILLLAPEKSLLAFADDTTGISVLVKAELNDNGNETKVSITKAARYIGNAVPPKLAEIIARSLDMNIKANNHV